MEFEWRPKATKGTRRKFLLFRKEETHFLEAVLKFIYFANTDWYLFNFRLQAARRLRDLGHEVLMLSPRGDYHARLQEKGFRWIELPVSRAGVNPFSELGVILRTLNVLRKERPDVLHNFTVKNAVYGSIAAKLVRTPAVINAVAGMGFVFSSKSFKARLLRPLVRRLMQATLGGRNSRLILQNPDDVATFVDEKIVTMDRIRLIRGSGVDTTLFAASRLSCGRLRVILCARLLIEKGILEFAEASRILASEGREVDFVLAGGSDSANPSAIDESTVRAWMAEGRLNWLGHVQDMPKLLASMHVMALPSFYREGVPRSLIEGAASGLAIITTNLPGCREVVAEDGKDGLWVEPRNAVDLARAIARLDDDRELLVRLASVARSKAVEFFDERLVIARTLEVYDELCGVYALNQPALIVSDTSRPMPTRVP